jgi:hypothetical protein
VGLNVVGDSLDSLVNLEELIFETATNYTFKNLDKFVNLKRLKFCLHPTFANSQQQIKNIEEDLKHCNKLKVIEWKDTWIHESWSTRILTPDQLPKYIDLFMERYNALREES